MPGLVRLAPAGTASTADVRRALDGATRRESVTGPGRPSRSSAISNAAATAGGVTGNDRAQDQRLLAVACGRIRRVTRRAGGEGARWSSRCDEGDTASGLPDHRPTLGRSGGAPRWCSTKARSAAGAEAPGRMGHPDPASTSARSTGRRDRGPRATVRPVRHRTAPAIAAERANPGRIVQRTRRRNDRRRPPLPWARSRQAPGARTVLRRSVASLVERAEGSSQLFAVDGDVARRCCEVTPRPQRMQTPFQQI